MLKQLEQCLAQILNISERKVRCVGPDEPLTAIGLDSLKTVQLVVLLEEVFQITIDDTDLLTRNLNTKAKLEKMVIKYSKISQP